MWKPIIEKGEAEPYKKIIEEIYKTVNTGFHDTEMKKVDVMYGSSSFLLFYSYIGKFFQNPLCETKIDTLVNNTFEILSNSPQYDLSVGQGTAGVVWAFQHLINNEFIDADFDEIFCDVIQDLEDYSLQQLSIDNYDYLLGGLGYLLLVLDNNTTALKKLHPYVEKVISRLLEMCNHITEDKIAWPLKKKLQDFNEGDLVYNLGISHGIPSIIILLSLVYEKFDNLKLQCRPLIEKSINWVLSTKSNNKSSTFGYSVVNGEISKHTTLRWCYGDLGIGVCLYIAGIRLENKNWQKEAIDTMLICAKRIHIEIAYITDAHICHGVAGVGHIFNRFYQYTKIESFKNAAILCFKNVSEKIKLNDNGNIVFLADKSEFGFIPFGGLMEGSTGIALTLISAISDTEPKWDRIFLLS